MKPSDKATTSASASKVARPPLGLGLAVAGFLLGAAACGPASPADRSFPSLELNDAGSEAGGGAGGSDTTVQLPNTGGTSGSGGATAMSGSGGSGDDSGGTNSAGSGGSGGSGSEGPDASLVATDTGDGYHPDAAPPSDARAIADASPAGTDAGSAVPTAAALLAKLTSCTAASASKYASDDGESSTISICGLKNAYFWKADMDIDCDGKTTSACNADVDPDYQNETSGTDSNDKPLDASTLPFVVIPLPSSRFDYTKHSIQLGSVVAVIYKNKVEYGIFGDEGPDNIIGEASYAMAKNLGIDSDPATGGVDSGVTYVVFTGSSGKVAKLENHDDAVKIGQTRAAQLLREN